MTREELDARLDKLYAKSDEVKNKIDAAKQETREAVEDTLAEAKGTAVAAKENLREVAEAGKSKAGAEMLKLQMTVEKVKDDLLAAKEGLDQKRMAKQVEAMDDFAADAVDVAMYAMDEAVCAVLEAVKARMDYEEKYGA